MGITAKQLDAVANSREINARAVRRSVGDDSINLQAVRALVIIHAGSNRHLAGFFRRPRREIAISAVSGDRFKRLKVTLQAGHLGGHSGCSRIGSQVLPAGRFPSGAFVAH
jgi:hypothetical protein